MTPTHVIVEGTVNADGSLDLDSKLAAGPRSVDRAAPAGTATRRSILAAHAGGLGRSKSPRTNGTHQGEIDAEISTMREEADEEMQATERLQRSAVWLEKALGSEASSLRERLSQYQAVKWVLRAPDQRRGVVQAPRERRRFARRENAWRRSRRWLGPASSPRR